MSKITIIGPAGSGKSTFSRRLGEILDIPVIHLDQFFFKENWEDPDREEYQQTVEYLCNRPAWIMEGGYGSTLNYRLRASDKVIYLDEPGWICLTRVIKRTISYYGKTRPTMAPNCPERFSIPFLYSILIHNWVKRPAVLQQLSLLDDSYDIHVLKGASSQTKFLESIEMTS